MTIITNEFMQLSLAAAKTYTVCIFKLGPKRDQPDAEQIQWEHARYMFELREEGKLSIVCAMLESNEVMGVGIFNTDIAGTTILLEQDPNVKAGRLVFELYPCMSFPGDKLDG